MQQENEFLRKIRKCCIFLKSFYRNLICKRKFKSYWLFLTDPEYRKDIEYLYEITKHKRVVKYSMVRFGDVVASHKVIYPEYVNSLNRDNIAELIKVTEDGDKYRVVDGNHRFAAMQKWVQPEDRIIVAELV